MKRLSVILFAGLIVSLGLARPAVADRLSMEESRRQTQAIEALKRTLDAEPSAEAKLAALTRTMKSDPSGVVRRRALDFANLLPEAERDKFLLDALAGDPDVGVRSLAATTLGRLGSAKCLPALAHAAAEDQTINLTIGHIGTRSSARRAATFAVAELAARFPGKVSDEAAAKLIALKPAVVPNDPEGLADARVQALYQITRDEKLLTPFHEKLKSSDAQERRNGVVAFQFFKLKKAPADLVAALKDKDQEVRSWVALVLGGIGDPATTPNLIAAGGDVNEDTGVRCNAIHSLGRMKSAAAGDLVRKLLTDDKETVQAQAAIALYCITGEKVKQFPEGYNAD